MPDLAMIMMPAPHRCYQDRHATEPVVRGGPPL